MAWGGMKQCESQNPSQPPCIQLLALELHAVGTHCTIIYLPQEAVVHFQFFENKILVKMSFCKGYRCTERPCIFSWPMMISSSVNEFL